jgi:uracil-DNA glycosylase family 4
MSFDKLDDLNEAISVCSRCPRLVAYRQEVAREKRHAFRDETYWGRGVPGYGDPNARLLIVGLAPAAHGGNRTGRMFTGDSSGNFLYAALHRFGYANQSTSISRLDGLKLDGVYISAVARCAPPENKPTKEELRNCRTYLTEELRLLKRVGTIIALGKIAFDIVLLVLDSEALIPGGKTPKFAHNVDYHMGHYTLIASYHPSQRNTATGLLTREMFDDVFRRCVDG